MPLARQSFGWPELPTELTGWRYSGEAYQILIEPSLPSHRYVRTPDSPPALVPPLSAGPVAAGAGPSAPSSTVGRERQASARGRGGRCEPIMRDDDETSKIEEAVEMMMLTQILLVEMRLSQVLIQRMTTTSVLVRIQHQVLGAASMVSKGGKHPGQLKDDVASPSGTTIVGIHELEKGGFHGILMNAVVAAAKLSQEFSKR
ncbi:uncharacterized protein LOC114261261 [Camellia sinensis]|uniref:uncharacterized protein LOC114261261 n=1 Tax=Camellia sinensis TaxID=4442 RepID=UPI001036494D|nr:uncharacterized protein LOC114261261 [Camellia sinensis]